MNFELACYIAAPVASAATFVATFLLYPRWRDRRTPAERRLIDLATERRRRPPNTS